MLKKNTLGLLLGLGAIALLLTMYFVLIDRWPWQHPLPWHYNQAGYQQAASLSRQSGQPILLLIERRRCRRCNLLDEALLKDPHLESVVSDLILVRLDISANSATAQLAARYGRDLKLPVMFLETEPGEKAYPLHLNPELSHIWVPGQPGTQGNKMPLSVASLDLAIERTLQQIQPPTQSP